MGELSGVRKGRRLESEGTSGRKNGREAGAGRCSREDGQMRKGGFAGTDRCRGCGRGDGHMWEAGVDGTDRYGPTNANGERLAELEGCQEAEMI